MLEGRAQPRHDGVMVRKQWVIAMAIVGVALLALLWVFFESGSPA